MLLEACAAGPVTPPLEPHKRQRSTYFDEPCGNAAATLCGKPCSNAAGSLSGKPCDTAAGFAQESEKQMNKNSTGYSAGTPRLLRGYSAATPRLLRGYSAATPRLLRGYSAPSAAVPGGQRMRCRTRFLKSVCDCFRSGGFA